MWKRVNTKDRPQERRVGSPTLLETTLQEKILQNSTNVNSGSFSISARPAFGRKQTDDVLKELPALPFKSLQISSVNGSRPFSETPTTSSIYSQPSPEFDTSTPPKSEHPPRSSSLYPDDVSPTESEHTDYGEKHTDYGETTEGMRNSPDVSPISDSPSLLTGKPPAFTSGKYSSNIPVARKTRKFWNRPSTGSPDQGSGASLTHWDVYSGEPTTSEKGKPPSTTPKTVKLHSEPTPGRLNGNFGTSTHISGGSSNERLIGRKRVASRDLNNAPIIRPEWKGAGGRHKIVNPLLDKPLPPGQLPRFPAGRYRHEQEQKDLEQAASSKSKDPPFKDLFQGVTDRHIGPSITVDSTEPVQSNESYDATSRASPEVPTLSTPHQNADFKNWSLPPEDVRSPLARNPSNEGINDERSQMLADAPPSRPREKLDSNTKNAIETQSPSTTSITPNGGDEGQDSSFIESRFHADLQHMYLYDEPTSRFSATTYATTADESPPATPTPEVDSYSPAMSATPNSILNRKRPIPSAGVSNSKAASLKSTPLETTASTPAHETKRKSLPKSPPEVQAVSRVASIQAKLDHLRRRRNNLQTVIHELTHVVQPSSIAYDIASRQEIKKTVDGLNKELADVLKDEHETGLKLHRALKRNDEFAAYEPTSIWVRRVTS